MKAILIIFALFIATISYASAIAQTVSFFFDTSNPSNIVMQASSIARSSSAVFEIVTDRNVLCKYSQNYGVQYQSMEGTFDFNFGTVHKKTIASLSDGSKTYYVGCRNSSDTSNNLLTATFNIITPVTAQITLSDNPPISSGFITIDLTTSKIVQSTPSLSYSFNGVNYNNIPLFGSGTNWQGYLLIQPNVGQAIGSFVFSGYDLEGYLGNEIVLGAVFIVDSVKPATIIDVDATSYKGRVQLDWRSPENEIANYKIYRSLSPGVSYSDFYKEVTTESYSDTFVEDGKSYYYRVSAVDNADNEGELSIEVQATALIDEVNTQSGLAPELYGLVDTTLGSVNNLLKDISQTMDFINQQPEDERELFTKMGLEEDLESVKSEALSLSEDIIKYKSQDIARTELVNKLDAAELRINSIKRKVPEDLIILEQEEAQGSVGHEDIQKAILEIDSAIIEDSLSEKAEKSYASIEEFSFESLYYLYNLEIVYLDGTRSKKSIIKTKISSNVDENQNFSIISRIPKEIAESSAEIDIRTGGYEILKEDPILSFNSKTKEIFYVLNKHIDKTSLSEVKTFYLYEQISAKKTNPITGYFAFLDVEGISYYGLYLGAIIVLAFGGYFYILKNNLARRVSLQKIRNMIIETIEIASTEGTPVARKNYNLISAEYGKLSRKSKEEVYKEIEGLIKILNGH